MPILAAHAESGYEKLMRTNSEGRLTDHEARPLGMPMLN